MKPSTRPKIKIGLTILFLLLISGRFVIHAYTRAITNSDSAVGDQTPFLQLGLDLREEGKLTDGIRNPLYAAFLALVARRDWGYFTQAKLMSMGFGLLTIMAVFGLGWRYFNYFTGLVAAYLLSINVEFTFHSATALAESLLTLLFTLAWFAMVWALKHPDKKKYWIAAGAGVALAYLAKSSGQLLAYTFLSTSFLIYGVRLLRGKSLWFFLGAYLCVVSPLWVYNTIHYGSPTFNYATKYQLWMDHWSDWHPDHIDNLPTALTYWQTHSLAEIYERAWEGLKAERNILVKTLYPTRTLLVDRFLLSPLSAYTFILLACLPLVFWRNSYRFIQQQRGVVYLTALTVTIFLVLFGWYTPIIPATRFLLPIAPLIFIVGAYIVSLILKDIYQRGRQGRLIIMALLLVIIFVQTRWWLSTLEQPLHTFLTANLFTHDREYGVQAAVPLAWLADGYPSTQVVWRSSGHLPAWAYSDRLDYRLYPPDTETVSQLTDDLINRDSDFVIVDAETVSWYDKLLEKYFPSNGATIDITAIPENWELTYAYPHLPCQWCVFRLSQNYPPQVETAYHVGNSILLAGYDLSATEFHPGDTLHLTLHWLALDAVAKDYTVFTQLLGPDWQLHGQQDNQPLKDAWPTGRWQPGNAMADRYDLVIAENAPTGTYQILVGMYDPQTMERVTLTHHSEPMADNAIPLATINLLPNQPIERVSGQLWR